MRIPIRLALGLVVACLSVGCATSPVVAPPPVPAQDALGALADLTARAILAHPFPPPSEDMPLVVLMGIRNRTGTEIDGQALEETLITRLSDSGRVRFVETARRDSLFEAEGYRHDDATTRTRIRLGREFGADYMLIGALDLVEGGTQYRLTVEITDLETGLTVLRKPRRYPAGDRR